MPPSYFLAERQLWTGKDLCYYTAPAPTQWATPCTEKILVSISSARVPAQDTLVISAVVAACTLFILFYWLYK